MPKSPDYDSFRRIIDKVCAFIDVYAFLFVCACVEFLSFLLLTFFDLFVSYFVRLLLFFISVFSLLCLFLSFYLSYFLPYLLSFFPFSPFTSHSLFTSLSSLTRTHRTCSVSPTILSDLYRE